MYLYSYYYIFYIIINLITNNFNKIFVDSASLYKVDNYKNETINKELKKFRDIRALLVEQRKNIPLASLLYANKGYKEDSSLTMQPVLYDKFTDYTFTNNEFIKNCSFVLYSGKFKCADVYQKYVKDNNCLLNYQIDLKMEILDYFKGTHKMFCWGNMNNFIHNMYIKFCYEKIPFKTTNF